jgi:hypothetical protein
MHLGHHWAWSFTTNGREGSVASLAVIAGTTGVVFVV